MFSSVIIFEKPADSAVKTELTRFARRARQLAGLSGDVAILITGNRQLRSLNRRFRHKDKATDVLSFPRASEVGEDAGGDIAISADIAEENAERYGHKIVDELKILVLHGMLHLAGHDHEADNGEMAALELTLRARLKLPASLIDRASIDRASTNGDSSPASRGKARRRKP